MFFERDTYSYKGYVKEKHFICKKIQLLSLNHRYYSGSGWVRRLRGAQSCDVRLLATHYPSHECEAFSQISVREGGGSTVNISLYLNIYVILTMCRHHVQTRINFNLYIVLLTGSLSVLSFSRRD